MADSNETDYLLASQANADRLEKSLDEALSNQDSPPPSANDLEIELSAVINKHGLNPTHTPTRILARYLIRQLDNFREMEQEAQSDYASQQERMGSTATENGQH